MCTFSESREELNATLSAYLESLDSRQRQVEEIRQLHHKVWAMKTNHAPIIEHRTGSRVEKQTRICPNDIRSDIDFMLEVKNVVVSAKGNGGICFQPTSRDGYFGRILISDQYRDSLMIDTHLKAIFTESSLKRDKFSNRFVLVPNVFKQNVVRESGLKYQQTKSPQSTGPSIPGRGVVNEYDVVPCLRLNTWPEETTTWISRGKPLSVFDPSWRKKVLVASPVFLVAAGEINSFFQKEQFRTSFSMPEIECFKKLPNLVRQLFGLAKYVFTYLLSSVGFLSWFHIKYLLFWMVEKDEIDWNNISPVCFLFHLMDSIKQSVREGNVQHFFLDTCNIFPEHRRTYEREYAYDQILSDKQLVTECLKRLLRTELLETSRTVMASEFTNTESRLVSSNTYCDGYLTRLLSVIVFVWQETSASEKMSSSFAEKILEDCGVNEYTRKLVTILELYFRGNVPGKLSLNSLAHGAFLAYMQGDFAVCLSLCSQHVTSTCVRDDDCILGVTLTRYDRTPHLDEPLRFALDRLEQKFGTCPRVSLHPLFFLKHVLLQCELKKRDNGLKCLDTLFSDLHGFSKSLSPRTPYCGLLSYQAVAFLVIEGYNEYFKRENIDIRLYETDTYVKLDISLTPATCSFDLR